MNELLDRIAKHKEELENKYAGYLVAFVYQNNEARSTPGLTIKNLKSKKEIRLIPNKVLGNSEEEVKDRMIEIIKQPFRKEEV